MKATELLKQQHDEVRALFKRIEQSDDSSEQAAIFEELASNLVAHDAIEREIFYPACESTLGMTEELGEALVEHGVIEFSLFCADEADEDDFEFKCSVLREMLEHHIEEEEDELFPKVEKELGAEKLSALGEQMEQRFEEAKESDFRRPLHSNLKQVLSGAMKTKSASAKDTSRARTARASTKGRPGRPAAGNDKRAHSRNGMHRRA